MVGLWATTVADFVWLLDLGAGGEARVGVLRGRDLVALQRGRWTSTPGALVLEVGGRSIVGLAAAGGGELVWSGLLWRRQ
jgi:hypothetical protein